MVQTIHLLTKIQYGNGAIEEIVQEFNFAKAERIMIITDQGVEEAGLLNHVIKMFEKHQLFHTVFNKVVPDPDLVCISEGKKHYQDHQCDGILAVGGGSSIDTAKGVGLGVTNPGEIMDYAGMNKVKEDLPPIIAVPTTCGTGSEVTNVTVITNDHNEKVVFVSDKLSPDVAILDPKLIESLPSSLVAATGIDALTHAIEAYTNKNEDWYADACALRAIELIKDNIISASIEKDKKALANMLYASTLAGISFSLARLGLIHAMSHPVSGWAGVPHGLANAVLLPYIFNFNLHGNIKKHATIAKILGNNDNLDDLEIAQKGVDIMFNLNEKLNIPKTFKKLGVTEDLIPQMVKDTFKSGNIQINAREVTEDDVISLYKQSLGIDH